MKSLSIVMPAFNEEENIETVTESAIKILSTLTNKYEVLIVDDGSTDKTGVIARRLSAQNTHIRVIHHKQRLGVGNAIKSCLNGAKGDFIFFMPADGQQDTSEIKLFLRAIDKADIVIGCRSKRKDYLYRAILSKTWNFFVRLLFGLKIKDMNWTKLFKKEVIQKICIQSTSAFIDAEILIKAKKKGFRFSEITTTHYPRLSGKTKCVNLITVSKGIKDAIRLWIQLH
ncbi:MAG: glycosyltransferase family 2 protein [bacterium]|nr:glycosyltransferase family 2 protein [bacterium]